MPMMWNNGSNQQYPYNPYNYMNNPYQSGQSQSQTTQTQFQNLQATQPQSQNNQNNIIWVKGKENARSMQLAPNSTVVLLDSEVGKFYIKTTDDIGLGKLRVFSYVEQPDDGAATPAAADLSIDFSKYVTKDQLQEIIKEMKNEYEQSVSTTQSATKQSIIIPKK